MLRSARIAGFRYGSPVKVVRRWQSTTLEQNPYIHVFPHPNGPPGTNVLSYLKSSPPNLNLAIASTTELPPTPESLTENPNFVEILQEVVANYATSDPDVQAEAKAFASPGGSTLGGGATFSSIQSKKNRRATGGAEGGAGGASAQGGPGGAGVGGFIHVSDQRNPPDWGRIAYPEDILGSLQVNGQGNFVGENGGYQRSGTYRVITRYGILGLSPFLRQKLIESLQQIEKKGVVS